MKKYYIGDITIIENFKCETELTHSLLIPSDSFLFGNIFIQDSLMIVGTSRNKEGMISIYNLNTKERLLSICDKGKGNNEYLMQVKRDAPYVCPKTNHLLMNTYNGMLNYIQIDITQSLADGRMVITKNENFGEKYSRLMDYNSKITVFPNGDKLAFFTAYSPDVRDKEFLTQKYILEDTHGNSKEISIFPEPIYGSDNDLSFEFYASAFAVKPDGSKVVEVMNLFDLISITDLKTGKVKGLENANSISIKDIASYSRESRIAEKGCYYSVSASDDYIFVVNTNTVLKEIFEAKKNPIIQVYNWEGEPLAKLFIKETDIRSTFFDKKTNRLYSTNENSDIIYFDLTDVMKKIKQ